MTLFFHKSFDTTTFIYAMRKLSFGSLSLRLLYLSLSLNSGCAFGLLSLSVPDWFALSSSFASGSLSLRLLYLSLSLNSGCAFGLLSLSVPDWFALSSSFAFGSLSLSALHKKEPIHLDKPLCFYVFYIVSLNIAHKVV